MADAIGSVQGLSSGIQWRDMVDQLAAIDKTRELDPITASITKQQTQSDAWTSYGKIAQSVISAAATLKDGSAVDNYVVSVNSSATSGRTLLSAAAQAGATPGSYQVEVLDVARAEKLSGASFASGTTVLGLAPADFAVNGVKVSVTATDTLNSIRDKINAANSGASATGVTATVLGTASGSSRLVLTSDNAGARGIELVDSASSGGVLQQLGVLDGTYAGGTNANGTSTSGGFTSSTAAIGQLLGMSYPAPASIKVGNRVIAIDLAHDSLSSVVARIAAAGVGARVTTTTEHGVSVSRMQVDAGISAMPSSGDPNVPDPDSLRTLQMLGIVQGGRGAIAQTIASTSLTDASSAPATGTTLLSDLNANGGGANIQAGDTITVNGRRGDGTAVSVSLAVGAGSTMNDLLAQLNSVSGFGGGSRPATASIGTDGKIRLSDGTAGDSQLSLSLSVAKSGANGGGTTGIGAFSSETTGRLRQVTAGSDARVRVDGTLLTRTSNTISDAIGGVTLTLNQAEVGTITNVNVTRDTSTPLNAVKSFVAAYNSLQAWVKTATASGGDLENSTALKSSARSFTDTLLTDVVGAGITRTALAGVALDKTGVLTVDDTAFITAFNANPAGMKQLFALSGAVTGAGLEYVAAGDNTAAGSYDVVITSPATQASTTGSGATFPYVAGAGTTHLDITDSASGITDAIALAAGDDANAIATKLNTLFATRHMQLSANVNGGQLSIASTQYGSATSFTIGYDAGDTSSATQLGLAAGTFAGTDVAGTIGALAATGTGQLLTGVAGGTTDGLSVRYSGSATGLIGTSTVSIGVAAKMTRIATLVSRPGDGTVSSSVDLLARSITSAQQRSDDVTARLARRKQSLLDQFTKMESALQRIQQQGASITSALTALTALQSNK